ncbi:UNVERIFIED_ORG: tail tape-measure protein [Burkholderia sp. CF145]
MGKAQSEIKSALDSIAKSSAASAVMSGAQYAMEFAKGFADKIKAAIDQADAMGKLAQRVGTTTEALSALTYAGSFAGASIDDLTVGLKGMNKSLLDARDPASEAAAAYQSFGLNIAQLQKMDPAEAFNEIAEAVSKYADGAQKGAAINAIFGKSAQVLIPLLDGGKEGLAAARAEAEKLGLIISGTTARAMSDLNDDLERMSNVSKGAAAQVAERVVPVLDELVRAIGDANVAGGLWQQALAFLGNDLADFGLDVMNVAGSIGILTKELQGYMLASKQFAAGEFKQAWDTAVQSEQESAAASDELFKKITALRAKQRELADNPVDLGRGSDDWGAKKANNFTATLDANAAAAKRAKKEIDDFGQMLATLQDQYRRLASEGDPMKELLTDPKYLKMSQDQQKVLQDQVQAIKDKTLAIDMEKQARDNLQSADDTAYKTAADGMKAELDAADAMWNLADAYTAAVDPTIAYAKTIDQLNMLMEKGAITQATYDKNVRKAAQTLADANAKTDPWLKQLQAIKDAVDAFGKKSSDAFVDFIFSTKDASVSFSEMVTSILKDMAKMLMYQNVFQPLMKIVGAGVTGGGFDWSTFLGSATGRMSGGPVSAGSLYQVNELPGRKEFFIPNVGGRIATDAGVPSGPNVQVNVNMYGQRDDRTTTDTKGDERNAVELGKRISMVVRQVISTEKRTGGLLAS